MKKAFVILCVCWLAAPLLAAAPSDSPVEGHWEGEIAIPGQTLAIQVDLSAQEGQLTGKISIPVQGIKDWALSELAFEEPEISFSIPGIPGDPAFKGQLAASGDQIEGTFTQGPASLPFKLKREKKPADRARLNLEGFDEILSQAVRDWTIPGMAMAVVRGGEVVFAEGFGHRDIEGDLPMTADSLFAVGSTTKAFTVTVLGQLADEGKVEWDASVRDYIPYFRLVDSNVGDQLTVRDLVTHRSGMPRHDLVWYNNQKSTRRELVERLAHLPLSAPLRSTYQYNNLMFLTAGFLIETVTGQSWEDNVREGLLDPLGMNRSNFSVDQSQEDQDFAYPYTKNDEGSLERIPFRRIDLMGPAGSINSSVNEMSRWLIFNLEGGKIDGRRLISPTTLTDIHAPQMVMGAPPVRPEISSSSYAMGWVVDTYRGHRRISHGGGIDGFTTSVILFPDDDLGLVAFTNRPSSLPQLASRMAADRVLGLGAVDWIGDGLKEMKTGEAAAKEAEAKAETQRHTDTAPSHRLEEHVGEYQHPGYGTLSVDLADGHLQVTYNEVAAPLAHWHYNVFNAGKIKDPALEDTKFQFRLDVNGNIASVEATLEARLDPIVFKKGPDAMLSDPDFLQTLAGRYRLATQTVEIELAGQTLTASLPGQPRFTLVPGLGSRFVLKEVPTISVGFSWGEDGFVRGLTFYQPNGVFEAKRIK